MSIRNYGRVTDEVRRHAVSRVRAGEPVGVVAQEVGVKPATVARWSVRLGFGPLRIRLAKPPGKPVRVRLVWLGNGWGPERRR